MLSATEDPDPPPPPSAIPRHATETHTQGHGERTNIEGPTAKVRHTLVPSAFSHSFFLPLSQGEQAEQRKPSSYAPSEDSVSDPPLPGSRRRACSTGNNVRLACRIALNKLFLNRRQIPPDATRLIGFSPSSKNVDDICI